MCVCQGLGAEPEIVSSEQMGSRQQRGELLVCVRERGRALAARGRPWQPLAILRSRHSLSCSPAWAQSLPWGDSYRTGVFCQPRAGAGLPGLPCLLGVRVSCPQHTHMLGTPYSAVGDLISPHFVRVTEVSGMKLEKVGTRRQPWR